MSYCGGCFERTGEKVRIVGITYTCTYNANGKSYSHVACVDCARDAEKYGITVHPPIPEKKTT
jgi:hypothetical protein